MRNIYPSVSIVFSKCFTLCVKYFEVLLQRMMFIKLRYLIILLFDRHGKNTEARQKFEF